MKATKSIIFVSGLCAGIAVMLSCSDDAPSSADAATCDCDPAEPPLAGRTMIVASTTTSIAMGNFATVSASCPNGAMLLSGSCTGPNGALPATMQLALAGFTPAGSEGWLCTWTNNGTEAVEVVALAKCLLPPQ